jgi:trehalose/maltose hydrolase-like predicted phosphorylase
MGPDEFHEKLPGTEEGGLTDNAYTNIMVAWLLGKAEDILQGMENYPRKALLSKLNLEEEQLKQWHEIAGKLRLVISEEGIIAQFDGYFDLKELDWNAYRVKYDNIYRMDRILKAEGKSVDDYKVAKQADTLMTFYNLDKNDIDEIIEKLGYELPDDYASKNLRYYLERTSHGSTLSRVVHAKLANMVGQENLGWNLYMDALTSDYQDIQGGTTGEGIHAGVMAGTVWIALTTYAGLNLDGEMPVFKPQLPEFWKSVGFGFAFRGDEYECEVSKGSLKIRIESSKDRVEIGMNDMIISVQTNDWNEFE